MPIRFPLVILSAFLMSVGVVTVKSEALQYLSESCFPFHGEAIRCAMLALIFVTCAVHVARQDLDRHPTFERPPGVLGLRSMVCAGDLTVYGPVQAGWRHRAHFLNRGES